MGSGEGSLTQVSRCEGCEGGNPQAAAVVPLPTGPMVPTSNSDIAPDPTWQDCGRQNSPATPQKWSWSITAEVTRTTSCSAKATLPFLGMHTHFLLPPDGPGQ